MSLISLPDPVWCVLQEWPGNQVFLADGRIVLNSKWYGVLGTIVLLFVLEAVFLGLVAQRLDSAGMVLGYIITCGPLSNTQGAQSVCKLHRADSRRHAAI